MVFLLCVGGGLLLAALDAEYVLRDDVLLHFARTAVDRVRAARQIARHAVAREFRADGMTPSGRVDAAGFHRQLRDALLNLGALEFHDRRLRSECAARCRRSETA